MTFVAERMIGLAITNGPPLMPPPGGTTRVVGNQGFAIGAPASRHDPLGYDIRMELFGSKDSVVVGLDGRTPLRSLEPGALPSAKPAWRDFMERFEPAYRAELDGFLQAASDGSPSLCSGQDARRALVVAMAAERSRVERRPVRVEEFA